MQNTTFRVAAGLLTIALLLVGCASSTPRTPAISQFEDIPMPKGLELQHGKSIIIESPSVKAARLVYRGRIEPQSLGNALRTTLEANSWRHVSTTSSANRGSYQVYEKDGNSLQVHVYEGLWKIFTYVELDASRALSMSGAPPQPSALSTPAR